MGNAVFPVGRRQGLAATPSPSDPLPPPPPASSKGAPWGRKTPEFPRPVLLPRPISVGLASKNEAEGIKDGKKREKGGQT